MSTEMEANQFREFGKAMIDYVAEYLENIRDRLVEFLVKISKLIVMSF